MQPLCTDVLQYATYHNSDHSKIADFSSQHEFLKEELDSAGRIVAAIALLGDSVFYIYLIS